MAVVQSTPVKNDETKLKAKFPPFFIQHTGQEIGEEDVPVEVDGWVQANIDNGLLIKCS